MPSAFSDRDGITFNLRGVFSFPIEEYSPQLLPSLATPKSRAVGVLSTRNDRGNRGS